MLSDYIAWCIIVKPAHLKPRLRTAIWLSAQNFLDWPTGNFKEVYKILMNFSLVKKLKKKFKPLPWACYAIITEYVGLFFILSNCSIQSTFLLFCKILVYVVFAVANNTPYRRPLPESPYQLHPWVKPVPYLFIQFWFFSLFCFVFFFLVLCLALANCNIPGFIFLLSMR